MPFSGLSNPQLGLTPEQQLCVLLTPREMPAAARRHALDLMAGPVDWRQVIAIAQEHQICPQVYRFLRRLDMECVPLDVQTELQTLFQVNALRNEALVRELARLLHLLTAAGIPVIPLKGIGLAESLHGDAALRVCNDLDLLVPAAFAVRAAEILLRAGYSGDSPDWFFVRYTLPNSMEAEFWRSDAGMNYLVELHWAIAGWAFVDRRAVEDLWSEASPTSVRGAPAYALSQEWLALFLLIHVARHRWRGLKWLVDIHEMCCEGAVDWDRVRDKAERCGWTDIVPPTMNACRILFNTTIPVPWSDAPLGPLPRIFATSLDVWTSIANAFLWLRLLPGSAERIGYVARRFFVPARDDRKFVRLPASARPLYYIVRPVRLCLLIMRGLWQSTLGVATRLPALHRPATKRIAAEATDGRV